MLFLLAGLWVRSVDQNGAAKEGKLALLFFFGGGAARLLLGRAKPQKRPRLLEGVFNELLSTWFVFSHATDCRRRGLLQLRSQH